MSDDKQVIGIWEQMNDSKMPLTLDNLQDVVKEMFYGKPQPVTRMQLPGAFLAHCPEENFKSYYNSKDVTWTACGKNAMDIIQDRIKRLL